jgi:hypothetical protein
MESQGWRLSDAVTVVAMKSRRRPTGVRVADAFPALAAELEVALTHDTPNGMLKVDLAQGRVVGVEVLFW